MTSLSAIPENNEEIIFINLSSIINIGKYIGIKTTLNEFKRISNIIKNISSYNQIVINMNKLINNKIFNDNINKNSKALGYLLISGLLLYKLEIHEPLEYLLLSDIKKEDIENLKLDDILLVSNIDTDILK